jgi:four helix bundle protein
MPKEIDERTFQFACRAVDLFVARHRRGGPAREIARQFLRAATSIGANVSEAGAGQTKADFLAKLGIARKECREALFWLRLIRAKGLLDVEQIASDIEEVRQIAAVLTAIVRSGQATSRRGDLR